MPKSSAEIEELIDNFETRHADLYSRMDDDYDLWRLKEETWLDRWSENVTDNQPRVFVDSIIRTLEPARLNITCRRLDKDGSKERKIENFALSAFRSADDRLIDRLSPSLKEALIYLGALRGFMAGRVLCYPNPDDEEELIIDILHYDSRFHSYGLDSRGVFWSAYKTWRDPSNVDLEYGGKISAKSFTDAQGKKLGSIQVVDFWDDKYNQVLAGKESSTEIVQEEKHGLGRPPVIVIPCGSTPLIVGESEGYTHIKNWGESLLAGGRTLFKERSKLLSVMSEIAQKSRKPSAFAFVPDASKKVSMPYGKGEVTTLPETSKVQMVEPPEVAQTVYRTWDIIDQEIQRATLPHLWHGLTWKGQEWSGKGLERALQGPETQFNPLLSALSKFYRHAVLKMIDQYKATDVEWKVRGIDNRGREFLQVFKPDAMDGKYDIKVEFVSISPEEEADNYAKAQMAKEWAPRRWIREHLLKQQDPAGMESDNLVEFAEEMSPKIKYYRTIQALIEDKREVEAKLMISELQQLLGQEAVQSLQGQMPQSQLPPPAGLPQSAQPPQGFTGAVGGRMAAAQPTGIRERIRGMMGGR